MMRRLSPVVVTGVLGLACTRGIVAEQGVQVAPTRARPVFSVRLDIQATRDRPSISGRLLVAIAREGGGEPRLSIGRLPGAGSLPLLGRDVETWQPGQVLSMDRALCAPAGGLDSLPPGTYRAQAVLHTNRDLNHPNAPGDLFGPAVPFDMPPVVDGQPRELPVTLSLDQMLPAETLPPDTDLVRYVKLPSKLLTDHFRRPMYLRAGVILPKNFAREPDRRYPLRVHIGGYGARFTAVGPRMNEGAEFHETWMAADTPRFVFVQLDGAGPYGDPYYVDSPANGPYGQALMEELLPELERRFRCGGSGEKRVTDGGSTGGWVSLALQILHPTEFAGCWSFCPDPVDFRDFQKIDVYQDANAYLDAAGNEIPSARFPESGKTAFTVRTECSYENVLGHGDSWANSGGQWGAWNAAFGPALDAEGRPLPLWNPVTGEIDQRLATTWNRYDLRHHLETNWQELAPNLRGKIRIWVGDADDFFLDRAVRRLEAFFTAANQPAVAQVTYGKGQGHCFMPLTEKQLLLEMARVTGARP